MGSWKYIGISSVDFKKSHIYEMVAFLMGLVCDVDRARAGPGWDLGRDRDLPYLFTPLAMVPYHIILFSLHTTKGRSSYLTYPSFVQVRALSLSLYNIERERVCVFFELNGKEGPRLVLHLLLLCCVVFQTST